MKHERNMYRRTMREVLRNDSNNNNAFKMQLFIIERLTRSLQKEIVFKTTSVRCKC